MFTLKKLTILTVAVSLLAIACAPKKNAKQNIRGRIPRGASAINTVTGQNSGIFAASSFGTVSGFDQNFSYAAQMLAQGVLAGEQIGNVSPQPMQNKGVFFVGAGFPHYNSGAFNTGHLQIEIWDDLAGTIGSDGQPIPPVVLYIGPQAPGFVSVSGQSFGGQIQLTFTTQYEVVMLDGYIQGQNFVGTMSFSNSHAQGMQLGQFQVPACGFFRCQ